MRPVFGGVESEIARFFFFFRDSPLGGIRTPCLCLPRATADGDIVIRLDPPRCKWMQGVGRCL